MHNTEGKKRQCEELRGKGKNKSHYKVQCDAQDRTGTKNCSAKTDKG